MMYSSAFILIIHYKKKTKKHMDSFSQSLLYLQHQIFLQNATAVLRSPSHLWHKLWTQTFENGCSAEIFMSRNQNLPSNISELFREKINDRKKCIFYLRVFNENLFYISFSHSILLMLSHNKKPFLGKNMEATVWWLYYFLCKCTYCLSCCLFTSTWTQ